MSAFLKLSVIAALAAACAACSSGTPPAAAPVASAAASAPAASAPPAASAIPMNAPAASATTAAAPTVPPAAGPSLGVILERPSFAKAYAALDGVAALPAWAKAVKSDAPSQRVQVDGETQWLAHACAPGGCAAGELFVLADLPAQALHGVYVATAGSAGASVQQLAWLGKPDAATQTFLKDQLAQH